MGTISITIIIDIVPILYYNIPIIARKGMIL